MSNFKICFYKNGKFKSLQIGWKFCLALIVAINQQITDLIRMVVKWFLILFIIIKGLVADPKLFIRIPNY